MFSFSKEKFGCGLIKLTEMFSANKHSAVNSATVDDLRLSLNTSSHSLIPDKHHFDGYSTVLILLFVY